MSKMNAGQRTTHTMKPETGLYPYPNPMYDHDGDEKKQKMAQKGDFGGKEQLASACKKVHENIPCLDITVRTNSTVR